MRKQFLYRSIWMIYPLLLWACTKEDSADASSNLSLYGEKFKVGDQVIWHDDDNVAKDLEDYIFIDRYQTTSGQQVEDTMKAFTTVEKGFRTGNFVLSLYGEGIRMNGTLKEAVGEGACICLHLASSDLNKLMPGKYIYNTNCDKNTFTGYSTSAFSSTKESFPVNSIVSGEVDVEVNGGQYSVRLTGKNQNGGSVSCDYSGVVPVIDIKKGDNLLVSHRDISLAVLYDTIIAGSPDVFDNGFMISTFGNTYAGVDIGYWAEDAESRNNVDVALLGYPGEKKVYFMSPVKMRAFLLHSNFVKWGNRMNVDLYAHTLYMKAPADFTSASFDALGVNDFDFSVQEENVSFSYPATGPYFVFFQNGHGLKGVMKIKSIKEALSQWVRPTMVMDIKLVRDFSFLIK